MDVNEELKFLGKLKKKWGGGPGGRVGGQGGCERRIEVFVDIQKKKLGAGGRLSGWGWVGASGWGVRVDVNEELKFWENSKKKLGGGGARGVGLGRSGWITVVYVITCRNFWLQYRNIQDGGPNKHENVSSF